MRSPGCAAPTVARPIDGLRSFKCHNWAYAFEALEAVRERMAGGPAPT